MVTVELLLQRTSCPAVRALASIKASAVASKAQSHPKRNGGTDSDHVQLEVSD